MTLSVNALSDEYLAVFMIPYIELGGSLFYRYNGGSLACWGQMANATTQALGGKTRFKESEVLDIIANNVVPNGFYSGWKDNTGTALAKEKIARYLRGVQFEKIADRVRDDIEQAFVVSAQRDIRVRLEISSKETFRKYAVYDRSKVKRGKAGVVCYIHPDPFNPKKLQISSVDVNENAAAFFEGLSLIELAKPELRKTFEI